MKASYLYMVFAVNQASLALSQMQPGPDLEGYMRRLRADPVAIPGYANTLTWAFNGLGGGASKSPKLFRMTRKLLDER